MGPLKPLLSGQLCRSLWAPGFVKTVLPESGFADTTSGNEALGSMVLEDHFEPLRWK